MLSNNLEIVGELYTEINKVRLQFRGDTFELTWVNDNLDNLDMNWILFW